ncbi:MAG: hypothetical protein KAI02_05520 [Gammaproteobacteria bacterium]|nr:hypothetical protein [Gammaproteobacteria bacterium]
MKQATLFILVIFLTLSTTNFVFAGGGKGGGHYNRGGGGHNYYRGGYNNYRGGGRGDGYDRRGYYAGAALLGGIAGGIIGSSLSQPYYGNSVYVSPYAVRAVPVAVPVVSSNSVVGSNFLLRSNGDCFLITNNSNGNQVLSSVPSSNCQ